MIFLNKKYIWSFFLILIIAMAAAYILNTIYYPRKPLISENNLEKTDGSFYVVKDTDGKVILETGLPVNVDDEYINDKDVHYIVIRVEGNEATATIFPDKRVRNNMQNQATVNPAIIPGLAEINPEYFNQIIAVQAKQNRHVVIYHTHSDESFVPTSNKASEPGKGDVFQVGKVLSKSLRKNGISVSQSLAKHDPHDINAYHRSRRTITQLLKEQPDAAFDIHRDSAPTAAYLTSINGIESSRVMIVIGRSNPNMRTNLAYAKRVKAEADKLYPGLMRGIYIGKGNYNQDLYPTALLFEIGTESIPQDLASKGSRYLSDVLTRILISS